MPLGEPPSEKQNTTGRSVSAPVTYWIISAEVNLAHGCVHHKNYEQKAEDERDGPQAADQRLDDDRKALGLAKQFGNAHDAGQLPHRSQFEGNIVRNPGQREDINCSGTPRTARRRRVVRMRVGTIFDENLLQKSKRFHCAKGLPLKYIHGRTPSATIFSALSAKNTTASMTSIACIHSESLIDAYVVAPA